MTTEMLKHREIRRVLANGIEALLKGAVEIPFELYQFQRDTLMAVRAWLLKCTDVTKRGYIEHATGLGKTVLFSSLVHACPDLRVLIIVPTKILIEQTAPRITQFTGGMVGHISSLHHICDENGNVVAIPGHEYQNVVVTTDESFVRKTRELAEQFRPHVIFWDECHWGYNPRAQAALAQFPRAVVIGFSATPDYLTTATKNGAVPVMLENGRTLYASPERLARTHFETKIDERSVRWGIEEGWLAPLAWGQITFDASLDNIPTAMTLAGMDYNERKLQELLAEHWSVMLETICRLYERGEYDLPNRQTFAVCSSVRAAEELAKTINALGVPAACISGDTPTPERNELLARFRANELKLISSVLVLREGWDAPNADVCMMLRPTKSRVLYVQSIGRVLRRDPHDGYKIALVLDAHFQQTKLSPISAPRLFCEPGATVANGSIIVMPRDYVRGSVVRLDSQYLPDEAAPRIIVIDALDEIEYWAGPDGTFEADGEKWGSLTAYERIMGLSGSSLSKRFNVPTVRQRLGRSQQNRVTTFYADADVHAVCADLLEDLPEAGPDGTFEADGEVWGVVNTLASILNASTSTVRTLSKMSTIRSRRGKGRARRIVEFHSLTDVRAAVHELESLPRVNDETTLEHADEIWAGVKASCKHLGVSGTALLARIEQGDIRTMHGLDRQVRHVTLYALSDVKRACADLLEDLPEAGPNGTFEADGEVWGTRNAYSAMLHLTEALIRPRVTSDSVRNREGRWRGMRATFYALSDVRRACADLLEDLPEAGPNGTFEADGEVWGTIPSTAKTLGCRLSLVRSIVQRHEIPSRRGRTKRKQTLDFYQRSAVAAIYRELEAAIPVPKNGLVVCDGEQWATIVVLQTLLGISHSAIKARIDRGRVHTRLGKAVNGNYVTLYRVTDVRLACAGLLQELPDLNSDGTFESEGETWGALTALARIIGCIEATVVQRARKMGHENLQTRKCRIARKGYSKGQPIDCFALSEIRTLCADLLEDLPEAGPDGTFEADGEMWGTGRVLAKRFDVTPRTIHVRAKQHDIRTRIGRSRNGAKNTFYALSDMQRIPGHPVKGDEGSAIESTSKLPSAGKYGFIVENGEAWGLLSKTYKRLGTNQRTMERLVQRGLVRTRPGLTKRAEETTFYSVTDAERELASMREAREQKRSQA
ncbi:MAG: DEAD/DEAH box helicase [Candidatus Uhrbacteria bacterium]